MCGMLRPDGRTQTVRALPNLPMNSPSSKTTLSRTDGFCSCLIVLRSSAPNTNTPKSYPSSARNKSSSVLLPAEKTPSSHTAASASRRSPCLMARAIARRSDDDPMKTFGLAMRCILLRTMSPLGRFGRI